MATARTKLEALVVNDPSHPAIRNFLVALDVALQLPCEDSLKVETIKHMLEKLEKKLASG